MVSKKKRPPSAGTPETDVSNKKLRLNDEAGTSYAGIHVKEEPVPAQNAYPGNDDIPDWPESDLMELLKRIEKEIPAKDSLRFDSRADKLNWGNICFADYTSDQCREMWGKIQKRLRRFRLLREVLDDAKLWVSKPWTNFYRSQKQNRHPGLPRRPLSTYMLFYLEKKDKVARENPGLEMTGVSKCIAEMYKTLPAKKKQKYTDMAAAQRKEYEEKLEEFYREHPELVPKPVPSKDHKSAATLESGPRKPTTPFKLFYADKENCHKNDPGFDRAEFLEKCREQWRNMSDKKKVVWINWALEEEAKYQEELKAYMSENPNFVPSNVKTILTKEEKNLKERVAGKPEKPPNSGYSLFSRIMLVSPQIKEVAPKERMSSISKLWKTMPESEKKKYQEQVNHMLDQYKLEYATYLESLPEDKRQEELLNNQPKRKAAVAKNSGKTGKDSKKKGKEVVEETSLYKGEPEPPPVNAYQLFLKNFMTDASHIAPELREKEAPRYWQMLPDADKAKHRKKLNDIKQKYIQDYEKFLKSLSQEQLKDYSVQKASQKKDDDSSDNEEDSDSDSDSDDDDDDSSDESKNGNSGDEKESGSDDDDSSSDSGSDSNDSSDSSDSDADNNENNDSGESSSSGSDSD